jgi:hypothetical protein
LAFSAPGGSCGISGSMPTACTAGSVCRGSATPSGAICVAVAADGDACDLSMGPTCLPPARCVVPAGGGVRGTCVPPDAKTCG